MSDKAHRQHRFGLLQWARYCRKPLIWIWMSVLFGLFINVGSSWLTTRGFDPSGTPLGWLIDHLWVTLPPLLILVLFTLLATLASLQEDTNATLPALHLPLTPRQRLQFIHQFQKEYARRLPSFQGQTSFDLHLREHPDIIASSTHLVFRHLEIDEPLSSQRETSIIQAYDQTQRGLLILGAPGSGKTTLLLELAQELLQRAENDLDHPLAIILNLSSWAKTQLPFTQWLCEQCWLAYGIPAPFTEAWITRGQVQFLLDGLDEMEASKCSACIEAINSYLQAQLAPLVVCSRSLEYESQSARLILPRALEIQPLEPAHVSQILKQAGKSFAAVRAVLRSNTVLNDLLTTPLILRIVMQTYRDKTVKALPQMGTLGEQQQQIFEHYVQTMLKRYKQSQTFSQEHIRSSLAWLARQMQQRHLTEFHLEALQAEWLEDSRALSFYTWASEQPIGLTIGSLVGMLLAFLNACINWLTGASPIWALITAPIVGVMFGALFGSIGWRISRTETIQLTEKLTWSWRRGGQALAAMIISGPLVGLFLWLLRFIPGIGFLIDVTMGGSTGLLTFMLIFTPIIGLLVVLLAGLSNTPQKATTDRKPNRGIHITGWNALRLGLTLLVGTGLIGGLILGLIFGSLAGEAFGLFVGLFFGLVGGLRYGGLSYCQHYLLRFLLARSRALPWHAVQFLEEATRCILLQRVGSGYRFVHPLFQEYFASLASSLTTQQ